MTDNFQSLRSIEGEGRPGCMEPMSSKDIQLDTFEMQLKDGAEPVSKRADDIGIVLCECSRT